MPNPEWGSIALARYRSMRGADGGAGTMKESDTLEALKTIREYSSDGNERQEMSKEVRQEYSKKLFRRHFGKRRD